MPCFSAANVRFVSAQQQQEMGYKERVKTASRAGNSIPDNFTGHQFSNVSRRECAQLLREKGHDFYLKPATGQPKINPKFRHHIKSQPPKLTNKDLQRLQSAAKVITVEERLEALEKQERLARELDRKTERLRQHFREIDEKRMEAAEAKNAKEDVSGGAEKQQTLERAFIEKYEQEEEVKAVNRIILNAKCHAVRDAQIQEKHDIERDQKNEELRLEKAVIEVAIKALAEEDCNADNQKLRNAQYAMEIREQLMQRENIRFMEAERAEEEARIQREANAALKREEERAKREARLRQQQFRAELNRIAEMSHLFKKMLCEQEREADMRVAAYMREKRERQKELEREKALAREQHERKQQYIYQLAQKIMNTKSQRDELSYLREQERVEREYRRREKEAAMRKKQLEEEIKAARERQMQEMKSRQALQIAREEKDFNILIDSLKKEEARLKKLDEDREKQRKCYRSEIIRQMSDKAMERRRMTEFERSEANIWREAERQRDANIRTIIHAKLAAMREACLPEHYIKDVERQLERIIKKNPQQEQQQEAAKTPF